MSDRLRDLRFKWEDRALKAEAEVERLREVLRSIADAEIFDADWQAMRIAARSALVEER